MTFCMHMPTLCVYRIFCCKGEKLYRFLNSRFAELFMIFPKMIARWMTFEFGDKQQTEGDRYGFRYIDRSKLMVMAGLD